MRKGHYIARGISGPEKPDRGRDDLLNYRESNQKGTFTKAYVDSKISI